MTSDIKTFAIERHPDDPDTGTIGRLTAVVVNGEKLTCSEFYAAYPEIDRHKFVRALQRVGPDEDVVKALTMKLGLDPREWVTQEIITLAIERYPDNQKTGKTGRLKAVVVNGETYTCPAFYATYPWVDRHNFTRRLQRMGPDDDPITALNIQRKGRPTSAEERSTRAANDIELLDKVMPAASFNTRKIL